MTMTEPAKQNDLVIDHRGEGWSAVEHGDLTTAELLDLMPQAPEGKTDGRTVRLERRRAHAIEYARMTPTGARNLACQLYAAAGEFVTPSSLDDSSFGLYIVETHEGRVLRFGPMPDNAVRPTEIDMEDFRGRLFGGVHGQGKSAGNIVREAWKHSFGKDSPSTTFINAEFGPEDEPVEDYRTLGQAPNFVRRPMGYLEDQQDVQATLGALMAMAEGLVTSKGTGQLIVGTSNRPGQPLEWTAGMTWGEEEPGSPMVEGAAYGHGATIAEALRQALAEAGVTE